MTIRSELEARVKALAASQTTPWKVALENVPFTKSTTAFLECFISSAGTINPTVDAQRTRERGVMQVNCWHPSGFGMGAVDAIAAKVVAAFPVIPKTGVASIEETPSTSKAITEISGWVIVPVTIKWRCEGTV